MKRLLAALVLVPTALFAQADRDVLLTSDGTLYTIESKEALEGDSNRSLQLTIRSRSSSN